jgi:hypothetical protein
MSLNILYSGFYSFALSETIRHIRGVPDGRYTPSLQLLDMQ